MSKAFLRRVGEASVKHMGKRIKLFGERNTNTNYISKLIELNFQANEVPGVVPPTIR